MCVAGKPRRALTPLKVDPENKEKFQTDSRKQGGMASPTRLRHGSRLVTSVLPSCVGCATGGGCCLLPWRAGSKTLSSHTQIDCFSVAPSSHQQCSSNHTVHSFLEGSLVEAFGKSDQKGFTVRVQGQSEG